MSGKVVTARLWKDRVILIWGRETFYDARRQLLTWQTIDEARQWLKENHPKLTFQTGKELCQH